MATNRQLVRAAEPYMDAEKVTKQGENDQHLDAMTGMDEGRKASDEKGLAEGEEQRQHWGAEQKAYAEKLKAEKAAKKQKKK